MEVLKTPIEGLLVIKPKIFIDDRGNFFESWSQESFAENGLDLNFVQDNQSLSETNGFIAPQSIFKSLSLQSNASSDAEL